MTAQANRFVGQVLDELSRQLGPRVDGGLPDLRLGQPVIGLSATTPPK